MVYLVIGDRDRAQVFLERALELRRPLASQDPRGLQTSLIRVGDLRRERDDIRGALSLHGQALEAAVSPWQKARALYSIGRDHEQSGALATATQAYKRGLDLDVPQDFPVRVALMGPTVRYSCAMETTAVARWSNVRLSCTKRKAMSTEQPKTMSCLPRKIVDASESLQPCAMCKGRSRFMSRNACKQ